MDKIRFWLFFGCLVLLVGSASAAAPVANFTVNVTSGTVPLSVSFTDLSLNNPTGWAWFFGDENYTAPWTQQTASAGWSGRWGHSSVVMPDGSIVLMGGVGSGPIFKNDVWRSTDNGATWSKMNASAGWTARALQSSVVMPDSSIVLMGGNDGGFKNDVWRSTDNGATWTEVNSSAGWSGRYAQSGVVMPDSSIVLMGGYDGGFKNDVWRSTDNGATWAEVSSSAGWSGRWFLNSVAMPDGSIVLMGGDDNGQNWLNDVWRSTDNGATWILETANADWPIRAGHTSLAMPDGSIILAGGDSYDVRKNDVWRLMPAGSSAQNPSHTYTLPGLYPVALQVYNNTGGYNSTRKTGYIFASTDETGIDVFPKSVKNTSSTYLTIYGRNFTNPMNVELRKQNITVASAKSVVVALSSTLMTTFDLTQVPEGTYDLAVTWPDGTQKTKPAVVSVSAFPEGVLFQNSDMTLSSGGTVSYSFDVQPTISDLFITLQKSTFPIDGHWSWTSEMTLSHNGNVTATLTSNQDPIIQIKNPEPGPYTLTIKATESGKGVLTVRSKLPDMPLGNWVVDTIQRPFGSSFHQVNIPAGRDQLTIEAETMNDFSFFRIYYDTYGGSPKWVTSYSQTKVIIPHPAAGRYIVEFVDPQVLSSTSQKRDILLRATTELSIEPQPTYNPVISGFTPMRGGNSGIVTLQINGGWLDPNSTVILSDSGAGNITALSVEGTVDRRSLTASFDLQGKAPGSYTLTVQSPNRTEISAPTSFLIEQGGKSELWTELNGMDKIRVGRPARYILKYGNKGNLDMPVPLIALSAVPSSGNTYIRFNESDQWTPMTGQVIIRATGPEERPDTLPAGSSFSREVQVYTNDAKEFALTVTPYGGDPVYSPSTIASVVDAAAPSPGLSLGMSRSYPGTYSSFLGPFGYGWVHSFDMQIEGFADGNYGLMSGNAIVSILYPKDDGTYAAVGGYPVLTRNGDGSSVLTMRDGSTVQFGTNQRPSVFTDTNGNKLTLTYSGDQFTRIRHSDGDQFSLTYNGDNMIATLTDQSGKVTTYSYNAGSTLLTSVTAPDGKVTTYTYGAKSGSYGLTGVTYPGGRTENFNYDGDGRLAVSSLNNNKDAIPISYDENSRTTTMQDADGSSLTMKVNENGQVTKTVDTAGSTQQFTYNANEDLVQATDALGHSYQMTYDGEHNIKGITDPLGNSISTTYDSRFNRLSSVTDARGNTMGFTYDSKANLIGITSPDAKSESNVYDSAGNLIQTTKRNGDTITYQYTSRGQISRINYPDGTFAAYVYDTAGNMLTATNSDGTISFTYNAANQPTKITYPDGSSFTYNYDDAGRLSERKESSGYTTDYGYDATGNLITVSDGTSGYVVKYTYNAAGKVTRKDLRNGGYTTYSYDTVGQVSGLLNYNTTGTMLSRFDYQYDANGNPVSIDTLEGLYQYGYDALGQLVSVTYPGGTITQYTYDAAGNRVSVTDNGITSTYATNTMNQYGSAGGATFTYDANGNMASRTESGATTTYTYNYENRLTKVTSQAGTEEYTYDALGNRVGVTRNGTATRYVVDPLGIGNVVAEYAANGTLVARYTQGLGLVSKIDPSGKEYAYDFSAIGHTSEITDSSGNIVNRYQYAPFGEYRQKVEGITNPFTYVGEYGVMDDGNGLQYMRNRYYSSKIGQFLTGDLILIPGYNQYWYCHNNPMKYVDPSGLFYVQFYYYLAGGLVGTAFNNMCIQLGSKYPWIMPVVENIVDIVSPGPFETWGGAVSEAWDNCQWDIRATIDYYSEDPWDRSMRVQGSWEWNGDQYDMKDAAKKWNNFQNTQYLYPNPTSGDTQTSQVVSAIDPEDKYGPTGYDTAGTPTASRQRFVPATDPLNYKVEFWNAEMATANVCDVDAYDQMDSDLNWSTFQFTEVGFTDWTVPLEPTQYFNVYVDPRPSIPYIVQIEGSYNPGNGKANITYHTLDPTTLETPEDPLAGFLPPISNSGKEMGWFAYTVSPKSGLSTGTAIDNQAFVNFDYSQFMPAPKDAPWHNTIDTEAPLTGVSATLTNQTEIHFTLSGSDDAGGSGIKDYTIYGSDNGGPYSPYMNHVTSTTGAINGIPEHTYRFFSIARDNVGNTEPLKSQPDATVFIPVPLSAPSAWFTASPNSGPAPLTVNFTDQSDNNPITWNWNFGDGSAWVNGTTQTVSHTYIGVGSYMATLVVSNNAGQDKTQRTITVNTPTVLMANFTANVTSGKAPLSVQFNDTSSGGPAAWYWEFGDGGNSTVRNATHVYHSTGTFTVNLTATNASVTDIESKNGYINVTRGLLPLPGFTNPPTDPDNDGLYEDLNGNGRKDFNDVVVMFNQMQWIAANEPLGAFDFDFNANGRIDFNDIVKLFGEI